MPDLIRCPSCGSSNPAAAEWCGQCFTTLASEPAADPEPPTAEPPSGAEAATGWECRACGHVNDVADSVCAVCGTTIFESYGASEETVAIDADAALRRAIIFPGFGYSSMGLGGIGGVVGFLAIACAAVGVMLLATGELVGLVLVAVFIGIWVVSIIDVIQLSSGSRTPLLTPRVLSIVGGAVVALLMLTVLFAFQSVTG